MQRIKATGWVPPAGPDAERESDGNNLELRVMKALGVALNPYPVADVLGGTICDATMVVTLGESTAFSITTEMPATWSVRFFKRPFGDGRRVARTRGSSDVQGLTFGLGTVATHCPKARRRDGDRTFVGESARYYFEHGASWGAQGPKRVITQILENTDKHRRANHCVGTLDRRRDRAAVAHRLPSGPRAVPV